MPKAVQDKVGSRNREKSAHTIQWLVDGETVEQSLYFDILLDENGEFLSMITGKGIELEEGTDYQVVDSDGEVSTLKSAPEKVRKLICAELANRLNVPTSVKLPENGQNVAAASRNNVKFRARMDSPFLDQAALIEYVEKNDGTVTNVTANGAQSAENDSDDNVDSAELAENLA